jgi:hypothetical protein
MKKSFEKNTYLICKEESLFVCLFFMHFIPVRASATEPGMAYPFVEGRLRVTFRSKIFTCRVLSNSIIEVLQQVSLTKGQCV